MKKYSAPIGMGIVTILTVLLVLTLSVFSALTLSSARADLALSKVNADTVSAYYAADSAAARLYADFSAGTQPELKRDIPMANGQVLHLHLVRTGNAVEILAWRAVSSEDAPAEEIHLPVFGGTP